MGFFGDLVDNISGGGGSAEASEEGANIAADAMIEGSQLTGDQIMRGANVMADHTREGTGIYGDYQRAANRRVGQGYGRGINYLQEQDRYPTEISTDALRRLGGIYGVNGGRGNQQQAIRMARQSPIFQALMATQDRGEDAILRNASATGGLRSGTASRNLADFNQELEANALLSAYGDQLQGLRYLSEVPTHDLAIAGMYADQGAATGAGVAEEGRIRGTGLMRRGEQLGTGLQRAGQAYGQGIAEAGHLRGLGRSSAAQAIQQGRGGILDLVGTGLGAWLGGGGGNPFSGMFGGGGA